MENNNPEDNEDQNHSSTRERNEKFQCSNLTNQPNRDHHEKNVKPNIQRPTEVIAAQAVKCVRYKDNVNAARQQSSEHQDEVDKVFCGSRISSCPWRSMLEDFLSRLGIH